jgi:hypothetical protein
VVGGQRNHPMPTSSQAPACSISCRRVRLHAPRWRARRRRRSLLRPRLGNSRAPTRPAATSGAVRPCSSSTGARQPPAVRSPYRSGRGCHSFSSTTWLYAPPPPRVAVGPSVLHRPKFLIFPFDSCSFPPKNRRRAAVRLFDEGALRCGPRLMGPPGPCITGIYTAPPPTRRHSTSSP